jgi:hypothetical protein
MISNDLATVAAVMRRRERRRSRHRKGGLSGSLTSSEYEAAQKKRSRQPGRPPLVHGQRELLRAWAYSARFHTSSAFPPDEVRATPKVKSSPASLMIDHF